MSAVLENILTRRSVRSFQDREIPKEDFQQILTAGSYAPTGMGLQSWQFTATQNPSVMAEINEALRQALLATPILPDTYPYLASLIKKAVDPECNFLYHAPAYVLVSNVKDNRNAIPDCALAIGNMMLAAHDLGIGSCWLNQLPGMTHQPVIRALMDRLDIPEDHLIFGSVVLGYPAKDPKPAAPRKDVIRMIE